MIKRYRGEIFLAGLVLALCFFAVRAFSQEQQVPKTLPYVTRVPADLKPGDEVKPTELEAAKLGKLKAQLDRDDAQATILQQQFAALQNDKSQVQAKIDALVKDVQARVKDADHVDVVYDQRAGEDGTFRVNAPPPPKPAESTPTTKK